MVAKKEETKSERITLDLPAELLDGVKEIAEKEYLSVSDVIRSALKVQVANHKAKKS